MAPSVGLLGRLRVRGTNVFALLAAYAFILLPVCFIALHAAYVFALPAACAFALLAVCAFALPTARYFTT